MAKPKPPKKAGTVEITREQLLRAPLEVDEAGIHEVDVNGQRFRIRELTVADWDKLYPPGSGQARAEGGEEEEAPLPWAERVLSLCLVDEEGRPYTGTLDWVPLRVAAVLLLYALRVNGLTRSDPQVKQPSPGPAAG